MTRIVWVGPLEPAGNLFGRPQRLQLVRHSMCQPRVLRQLTRSGTTRPSPGCLVGLSRSVTFPAPIAFDFTTDGGRRSPQLSSERTDRTPRHQASGNFL